MKEREHRIGKKRITVDVPSELYDMFAKLCIDNSITKTEGLVRYLKFLKEKNYHCRNLVNENTNSNFDLNVE